MTNYKTKYFYLGKTRSSYFHKFTIGRHEKEMMLTFKNELNY